MNIPFLKPDCSGISIYSEVLNYYRSQSLWPIRIAASAINVMYDGCHARPFMLVL
jgi:hypothetical protein